MIRPTSVLVALTLVLLAGNAQAHLADVSHAQHAAEHAWLALLLLPAGMIGLRLLRRRR